MKIIFYDGTVKKCGKVEFSTDGTRIIVDDCEVYAIAEVLRILGR